MGASPETTAFLKECLADAFIELLGEKPAAKVTVTEIAARAGVGRTTYFRNFSCKEDMLSFKLIRLWQRWAEEHALAERYDFSLDNALTFFEFNLSIRPLLELIHERDLQATRTCTAQVTRIRLTSTETSSTRMGSTGCSTSGSSAVSRRARGRWRSWPGRSWADRA